MPAYFDQPDRVAELQFAAATWIGTPFMPNAAVKGAGVSCQKLAGALYQESGCLPREFAIPEGPMNWSHAHTDSLLADFMDAQPNFMGVAADVIASAARPPLQLIPGDLLGFRIGGCVNHCGVLVATDGQFIHCLRGRGVLFSNLRDASYLGRLEKVWRPVAAAF